MKTYTLGLAVTGNLHQWKLGGALKATIFGGIGGAVSFGVGSIFSNTAGTLTSFATNLKETIGGVGLAIVQAGTHAVSQGILSLMQGDSFGSSFTSAFLSSLGASGFGAIVGDWAGKAGGQIFFGALSGGIGAELSGGNFWQGATTSAIVVGLNHLAHMEKVEVSSREDPPKSRANVKISIGQPSDMESLIPVWGSGRSAIDHFQNGNYLEGIGYTALAVSDVFLVKSIATGVAKGGLLALTKNYRNWRDWRKFYGGVGFAEKGQHLHHWFLRRNGATYGLGLSWKLKNQMWNLMPMRSPAFHTAVHGKGPNAFSLMERFYYGTPTWFKSGTISTVGHANQYMSK